MDSPDHKAAYDEFGAALLDLVQALAAEIGEDQAELFLIALGERLARKPGAKPK
jgi:hypothetical protein